MTRPGIEPRSPGPLANTLTARPMSGLGITFNTTNQTLTNQATMILKKDWFSDLENNEKYQQDCLT